MYDIIFSETASKQFFDLEKTMQVRITKVLERIRMHPENYLKRLAGQPYYRLRVGDYRIIFALDSKNLLVIKIGHRRNIYD